MPPGDSTNPGDPHAPSPESAEHPAPARPIAPRAAAAACALLIVAFVALALWGARHRSATYDEPMHAVAAHVLSRHADFRANPEDPNLWQRWAALVTPGDALKVNFDDPRWRGLFEDDAQRWSWAVDTLYRTPGNDADAFLWRMRCMLVLLGAAAAALVAWWGWQLGGAVAAVVAAALFCVDPNFLAHATQIKNDVALTLVSVALAFALWRAGRRLTWPNALAVVAAAAAAPATKYSGVAVVGVAAFLLLVRAWMNRPWHVLGRDLATRPRRLAAAAALTLASCAAAFALLWATYAFRFNPSPHPGDPAYDTTKTALYVAINEISGRRNDPTVSQSEVDAWRPNPLLAVAFWAERNHLLPQTWLQGLLMTYGSAQYRRSFLLGQYSNVGFPAYFPLAFAFKTPVATILACLAGLATAVVVSVRRARRAAEGVPLTEPTPGVAPLDAWTALCLLVPPAVYLASAMGSNLNIGLRHILPVYPPLFLLAGWTAAVAYARWGRRFTWAAAALLAAVALETLLAAPNFLAFFNTPSGGARGGLRLLGDSNLDWGQDLPALADWQKRNPDRRLYLLHFGPVPPSYYGIRYIPRPGANPLSLQGALKPTDPPTDRPVLAISATQLQGIYLDPRERQAVEPFRKARPIEVLNGTIYLFDVAARQQPTTRN
jgi:hypothetical protein